MTTMNDQHPLPRRTFTAGLAALAALAPVGAARAQRVDTKIKIEEAWARLPPAGRKRTTAYGEIRNTADRPDRLLGVSSPWAESAGLKKYTQRGYDRVMTTVPSIQVRAGGTIKLSPGAEFILLEGLTVELKPDMKIPISLRFENAGRVEIEASVTNQLLGNMDDPDL
jgi:hypothetical protein